MPELIPFDPRARKALELTFREALRMGHNYIGTEHIQLALARSCSLQISGCRRSAATSAPVS